MKKFLFSFFIIATLVVTAFSQSSTWNIDVAHSNVGFSIAHLVISDVTGKFSEFEGSVSSPSGDFSGSSIHVVIKTASINTDNDKRNGHLKSADFFDAEKYPEITFKSTSFEKTGESTFKITGNLTMHGVTKEVVLDSKYKGQAKDPWGGTRAGLKATTTLDRYDFRLKYNSTLESGGLLIGQTVDIELNVELIKK